MFFFLFQALFFSQTGFRVQFDTIPAYHQKAVRCADGGYAFTSSYNIQSIIGCALTKTDSNGNLQWCKHYMNSFGSEDQWPIQLLATSDSGYYLALIPFDNFFGEYAAFELMKLDKNGNIQSSKKSAMNANDIFGNGNILFFQEGMKIKFRKRLNISVRKK